MSGIPEYLPPIVQAPTLKQHAVWADRIQSMMFRSASGHLRVSSLLSSLALLPLRHEPILRPFIAFNWRPSDFIQHIGESLETVEGTNIQIKGTHETGDCIDCRAERGPFAHCIRIPDTGACGNCHFGGNADTCSLNKTQRLARERSRELATKMEIDRQVDLRVLQLQSMKLDENHQSFIEKLREVRDSGSAAVDEIVATIRAFRDGDITQGCARLDALGQTQIQQRQRLEALENDAAAEDLARQSLVTHYKALAEQSN